jgi:hypothetical protein
VQRPYPRQISVAVLATPVPHLCRQDQQFRLILPPQEKLLRPLRHRHTFYDHTSTALVVQHGLISTLVAGQGEPFGPAGGQGDGYGGLARSYDKHNASDTAVLDQKL